MDKSCVACHKKTINNIICKCKPQSCLAQEFRSEAEFIISNSEHLSAPYLALLLNRLAKRKLGIQDLYNEEKKLANALLLQEYDQWKKRVNQSEYPLRIAAKLAVIGNIIDYGAHSVPDDICAAIEDLLLQDFGKDESLLLLEEVKQAKSILYLGDNAGEIVFDKLFIDLLKHPNVTFAVRGAPVINDVVEHDARIVGLEQHCKIISNGHDAPSTLLPNCSTDFQEKFRQADLVISKGQGNLEGLLEESHPNLFFMLMAKCDFIANKIGVNKGDLVIMKKANLK